MSYLSRISDQLLHPHQFVNKTNNSYKILGNTFSAFEICYSFLCINNSYPPTPSEKRANKINVIHVLVSLILFSQEIIHNFSQYFLGKAKKNKNSVAMAKPKENWVGWSIFLVREEHQKNISNP